MNYFCDVKVGDIRIIVKKQERGDFIFSNDSRVSSGFVCFLEGEGSLTIDGVGQFDIRPGSFVRYEKGDRYKINVGPSSLYYTSEIDIDVSSEFDFPRHLLCTEDELSLLERIWRVWSEQGEYCFVEARILLLRLLLGISRRIRSIPNGSSAHLNSALAYIHRHSSESFSLSDVAAFCNVSESYLRNSFREELGISVMQYRENLRIERAKTLLLSGEHRISEIASMLGYCDVYHFSRKFKQSTGLSPTHYIAQSGL